MLIPIQRKVVVSSQLSDVLPHRFTGERETTSAMFGAGTVTSSGSTHTKGSWVSLGEPTLDVYGLWLILMGSSITVRDFMVDIGVGPIGGGSEVAVVSNVLFSNAPSQITTATFWLPIFIKGGQRISARAQCSAASSSISVYSYPAYTRNRLSKLLSCETIGATTASTRGTQIEPGGTPGTKGSYSTLGTTTKRITDIAFAIGNISNTTRTTAAWAVDVAIGAGPTALLSDVQLAAHATSDFVFPAGLGSFPLDIPPGTDLKVRANCTTADVTDRLFDIVAYCFSEAK